MHRFGLCFLAVASAAAAGSLVGCAGKDPGATGSTGSSSSSASSTGSRGHSSASSSSSSSSSGQSGPTSSSSSSGVASSSGGTAWHNGLTLSTNTTIAAGESVTIDPGATIQVAAGVTIAVDGTLSASSSAAHATLTGTGWTGLVVSGTLSLDGVDISGASDALNIASTGVAEYDDGTISAAAAPFRIASGGALTLKHVTIPDGAGTAEVAGTLTASYLNYTGGGAGFFDGIVTTSPQAVLSVEDSTFTGPGQNGPLHDMLVSNGGSARFHVAYTTISQMHCGFHFDALSELDISYVDDDSNAYGFMLYGSTGAGPFTVSNSNIDDSGNNAYDAEGNNGAITFDGDYVNGLITDPSLAVTLTHPAIARVTGTGPR
jgi:hypothetical protein